MIVNNCLNIKFEEAHDIDTGNRTWDWAPLAQLHLTPGLPPGPPLVIVTSIKCLHQFISGFLV